jgi:hypothetical protein
MVKLTNAPEGRTYISYEWDLRGGAELHFINGAFRHRSEDIIETQTPHVVPDGKWVMERPSGWAWMIVGTDKSDVDHLRYTDKHGIRHVLYISDKPFGYIVAEEDDVDRSVHPAVPKGPRRLVYARQIHKGELGHGPTIERLPYVRQAYEADTKHNVIKARERRRGYGWVRLADLVEATGLSNEDIVFGYWDYSGHRNYRYYSNGQTGGVLLDIVRALSKDEIEGSVPTVFSVTQSEAGELLGGWNGHWFYTDDVWVRRGFAYTVLRLQALGVQPYAMQSA